MQEVWLANLEKQTQALRPAVDIDFFIQESCLHKLRQARLADQ